MKKTPGCYPEFLLRLHFSEQYFTSSQTAAHFLRQVNGRLQVTHNF